MSRASKLISIVAVSLLLATSTVASATDEHRYADRPDIEPNGVTMAADFLVARPLGLVTTVIGTGLFLLALPFSAMAGDIETPAHYLIQEPARFTFARPLGHVEI